MRRDDVPYRIFVVVTGKEYHLRRGVCRRILVDVPPVECTDVQVHYVYQVPARPRSNVGCGGVEVRPVYTLGRVGVRVMIVFR